MDPFSKECLENSPLKMLKNTFIFLVLNFAALAIGGLFTGSGVSSNWYQEINKAPWTPPGWVFGASWALIMVCFAIYMAYLIDEKNTKRIIVLYAVQWFLNVSWNPVFFHFQNIKWGLAIISSLTILVAYFFSSYRKTLKLKTILIAPYLVWLFIATSLNAYIYFYN
jgi:tryptophan-rich sensory protein